MKKNYLCREVLSKQKGQVIIEAVLLIVIMLGLWVSLSKTFIEGKYMKKLMQEGPWPRLSGMIEAGVWESSSRAKRLHPNNLDRGASKKEND
jgi:hypothetical protein